MGERHLVPTRAGTIRRVIRRGNTFICGLCRSQYRRYGPAQSCVEDCWDELLMLDPVIERRGALGVGPAAYRCRFCARDHKTRPLAEACAKDCRSVQLARWEKERQLLEDLGEDGRSPRRARPRPVLRAVPRPLPAARPKPPAGTARAEGAEPAAPVTADAPPPPAAGQTPAAAGDAAAPAGAADGGAGGAKKPKDPANAFYRDGARYVCKTCNEKYFTKDEVLKCYMGH